MSDEEEYEVETIVSKRTRKGKVIPHKPPDWTLRKGEIGEEELKEMQHSGWNEIKNLETDEDRLRVAKEKFKNSINSDPGHNLSFHGFKMKKAKQHQSRPVWLHCQEKVQISCEAWLWCVVETED